MGTFWRRFRSRLRWLFAPVALGRGSDQRKFCTGDGHQGKRERVPRAHRLAGRAQGRHQRNHGERVAHDQCGTQERGSAEGRRARTAARMPLWTLYAQPAPRYADQREEREGELSRRRAGVGAAQGRGSEAAKDRGRRWLSTAIAKMFQRPSKRPFSFWGG